MDEGARLWLIKTARKNYWRVWEWYDLDDLIQDGALQYQRIVTRYPEATEPKHLMALFKITYIRHIHTLASSRTREYDATAEMLQTADSEPYELEGSTLQVLIAQAPEPVRAIIQLMHSPKGPQRLRARYRIRRDGTRETLNERLCRLIGADPSTIDLPAAIKQTLRS